ncbi:MAG: OmpA family protein [Candidatus Methylomirabilis sp.]|nr:OmpA family protein [Deltaproteobacteria bacterium]
MARKKKHEEHANHERWLVSFADFMTLLFALFVVMFSVSKTDADKVGRFTESAQHAFHLITTPLEAGNVNLSVGQKGNQGEMGTGAVGTGLLGTGEKGAGGFPIAEFAALMESMDAPGAGGLSEGEGAALVRGFQDDMEQALGGGEGIHIRFLKDERGFVVSLGGEELFEEGGAEMRDAAKRAVLAIGRRLRTLKLSLRIEGHTDDSPMRSERFPSNWELSTARAASFVRAYIEDERYPPWALSAAGFGQWKPLADNATLEGRAANRRIDIIILGPWKEPERPDWAKAAEVSIPGLRKP